MVGLRWAPETGPAAKMNKGRTRIVVSPPIKLGTSAPVAKVLRNVIIEISANRKLGRTYLTVWLKPTARKQVKYTSKHVPSDVNINATYIIVRVHWPTASIHAALHSSGCRMCRKDRASRSGIQGAASGNFCNISKCAQLSLSRENSWLAPMRPANGTTMAGDGNLSASFLLLQNLAWGRMDIVCQDLKIFAGSTCWTQGTNCTQNRVIISKFP